MYVCMYVCIYVCKYICMYVYMHAQDVVEVGRVFAASCCASVVTAAEKAGSNMRRTEKVKSTLKEDIRTKRIRDETPIVKTPTQNFDKFTKLLDNSRMEIIRRARAMVQVHNGR